MTGVVNYYEFVIAVVVFLCIPGPGNMALISARINGGIRGGMGSVLGIMAADQILLWLAVLGLAAVLKTQPLTMAFLQYAGAAYLVWLGVSLLLTKQDHVEKTYVKSKHYFKHSFVITLLNPKAVIFYMTFLPLFIDPMQQKKIALFSLLALTVGALTFLYGVIMMVFIDFIAVKSAENNALKDGVNKMAGIFLLAFGLKMALTR